MFEKIVKLLLRLSLSAGFFSAVADRMGFWKENIVWGNWENFLKYTATLLPWFSEQWIQIFAIVATAAEIILGFFLLVGWKTETFAKLSGILLLVFALTMMITLGIKKPLDYSVLTAAFAAFAISTMKTKFLEIDSLFKTNKF